MRIFTLLLSLLLVYLVLYESGIVTGQNVEPDNTGIRRDFYDAQVIPHGSGKITAPLGMVFTKDGSRLLAWGEDQFVSNWPVNNGIIDSDVSKTKYHRWQFYRDSFGIIASGVLTKDNRYLLVAGNAVNRGEVAFHNLKDNTSYGIYQENTKDKNRYLYSTMAFNEKDHQIILGRNDGGVEIREMDKENKKYASQTILNSADLKSKHPEVILVSLNQDQSKLFVFWFDGNWAFWNIENGKYVKGLTSNILALPKGTINRHADISTDFKWFAYSALGKEKSVAMAVDFQTKEPHTLQKPMKAPGIRLEPFQVQFDQLNNLYVNYVKFEESSNEVLGSILAKYENTSFKLEKQFKVDYQIQSFCIHPDQKHLAITGGIKNEVSILNFAEAPKVVSSLALKLYNFSEIQVSEAGKQLALRIDRNQDKWLTFDLEKKILLKKAPEQDWAKPILNKDGWTFEIDLKNKYSVILKNEDLTIPIQLDEDNGWIKCASFLPGKELKIVLGHMYGATLYEVNPVNKKAVVIKALRGHKKYVVALTPSANGDILYTCGDDFSVAAFSLKDLPLHPDLGVSVVLEKNELIVDKVYPYSPGWLVGLKTRSNQNMDKITKFIEYDEKNKHLIYDLGEKNITPEDFKKKWDTPPVGKNREIYFDSYLKGMDGKLSPTKKGEQTRCLVRPTWKLMIDYSLDWVLYRWQDMFYDSSPLGDRMVGWVVCQKEKGESPKYSVGNQFINVFKKPELTTYKILNSLLLYETESQTKNGYPQLSSPIVELKVSEVEKKGISCNIKVQSDTDARELGTLERVLVYRDDYLVKVYQGDALEKEFKIADSIDIYIPISKLRTGKNEIRLIAETRSGVRAEQKETYILKEPPPDRPKAKMHAFAVGISDYEKIKTNSISDSFSKTNSAEDCRNFDKLVKSRATKTNKYSLGRSIILTDGQVTEKNIISELNEFNNLVKNPDDILIFLISGHGVPGSDDLSKKTIKEKHYFPCHNFNHEDPENTSLDADDIIGPLEQLPCRKLIIYNACHAGLAGDWYKDFVKHVNPVTMFCAASAEKKASEVPPSIRAEAIPKSIKFSKSEYVKDMHGIFTFYVMGYLFENPDMLPSSKNELSLNDLYLLVKKEFEESGRDEINSKVVLFAGEDKGKEIILSEKNKKKK